MNRIIKLRGQKTSTKEWVYGSLISDKEKGYAIVQQTENPISNGIVTGTCFGIIPETIGQYTDLKDKNGKEIYEGDIVVIPIRRILEPCDLGTKEILPIYWSDFGSWNISLNETLFDYNLDAEVIGNIYENPELLIK